MGDGMDSYFPAYSCAFHAAIRPHQILTLRLLGKPR